VTNKIPASLKLTQSGEDRIGTFLADSRKTTSGEFPAIVKREHFGEKPDCLERQIFVSEVKVCHNGIATVFVYTVNCHLLNSPLHGLAGSAV
jgi:hypothetical protein